MLPIACTLGADDGRQRIEEWRDVVRRFGTGSRREPGRLTLAFGNDASVGEELGRLVSAERDCCAFLGWELTRTDNGWALTVTGTDEELATVSLGEEES